MRKRVQVTVLALALEIVACGAGGAEPGSSGPAKLSTPNPQLDQVLGEVRASHQKLAEVLTSEQMSVQDFEERLEALCGAAVPQPALSGGRWEQLKPYGALLSALAAVVALLVLHFRETRKKQREYFFELMKKMEEARGARREIRNFVNMSQTDIGKVWSIESSGREARRLNDDEKQALTTALNLQADVGASLARRCEAWRKVDLLAVCLSGESAVPDAKLTVTKDTAILTSRLDELGRAFDVMGLFDRQGLVSRRLVDRFYSPPLYEFIPILRAYLYRLYLCPDAARRRNPTHFWELRELMWRVELVFLRHPAWRALVRWPVFARRRLSGARQTGFQRRGLGEWLRAWMFFTRASLARDAVRASTPKEAEVRRWLRLPDEEMAGSPGS